MARRPPIALPARRRSRRPAAAALLLCLAAPGALAQARAGFTLTPTAGIGQTVTDAYRPEDNGPRRGEAITSVEAGLRLVGRGARVIGNLDYSLTGLVHARDTDANELRSRLQAALDAELVPAHLSLGARASITQQAVSAVGSQSADGSSGRTNLTDLKVLSLQPTLKGSLGDLADLTASLALGLSDRGTDGGTGAGSDSTTGTASLVLKSTGSRRLGWNLVASRSFSDFEAGRRTEDDRITAGLQIDPDVDWQFRLRAGIEANDYRTATRARYDSWGAGLQWTPSPRTRVSLDGDRRAFGHSHSVALEHRSRRTLWRYTDGQDITRGSAETAQSLVGAYDLFFQLFASQEPDPQKREQLVDALLQRNGLTRESQVAAGFLTSAVTLRRRQEASLAIDAQRTTWLFSAFSDRSQRVDTFSTGLDDTSGGNRVRQRGLNVLISHRLTPTGAVNLAGSLLRSSQTSGLRTELRSLSAGWTERLSTRTSFLLSVRHTEFDAATDPYTENAVIANLNLRF